MKKLAATIICLLPLSRLRILLYRLLPGYRISGSSHIGWLTRIVCDRVDVTDSFIGCLDRIECRTFTMATGAHLRNNNRITLVRDFSIGAGSAIVSSNTFIGNYIAANPHREYCDFAMGGNSVIGCSCRFDLTDTITIGDNVVLGGIRTSIWTHGFDTARNKIQSPVTLGNDIYIGSESLVCQGVRICDGTVVGAGTVVSRSVDEPGFYVSNQLLRKSDAPSYGTGDNGEPQFIRRV